jgi:hypothetical protein
VRTNIWISADDVLMSVRNDNVSTVYLTSPYC